MTAGAKIFVYTFGTMGGVLVVTVYANIHIEFFGDVALPMPRDFSERCPIQDPFDHDFGVTRPAGLPDMGFMDRRLGVIMPQDVMFSVAMITKRKFFSWSDRRESQMYVFLIFLCFNRMAPGTIHIDKTLSEVEERIGIRVAVHTG
jgi:hypothetical protein